MRRPNRLISRRRLLARGAGVAAVGAGLTPVILAAGPPAASAAARHPGRKDSATMANETASASAHFTAAGGISDAYLVNQLNGNGQSIAGLAFITSAAGGNLELLGQGGPGTYLKLNYLDAGGTERTGLAVQTATTSPIVSIAPEANGAATLDLENNDLTGVITVVPSPDNAGQLSLDGLLALTPQDEPARPGSGGVLYVDAADGGLKFKGSAGTVTTLAPS